MRHFATIILIIGCWIQSVAQPVCHVQRYDNSTNTEQWHVTQILQDAQGMIWMSTWNGLSRFDGRYFRCFKSQPGDGCDMPTDRIRDIWLDGDGNIGCMVDEQAFTFNVRSCRFMRSNTAKRGRANSVFMGNGKVFKHTDDNGTRWMLDNNGRLQYVDNVSGKTVDYPLGASFQGIRFCMVDRQRNLWVVDKYCIYKLCFDNRPAKRLQQEKATQVRCMKVDSKRRCWVTTRDDATVRLLDSNGRPMGYLGRDGALHDDYTVFGSPIYCVTESRDGTIYFGSKPDGLFQLRERTAGRGFDIRAIGGLNCNNVYDIKEDRQGRLWVATLGGGINCVANPRADKPIVAHRGNALKLYPRTTCGKVRFLHITNNDLLLAATTEGLLVASISANDSHLPSMSFKRHVREAKRYSSLSCSATMDIAEDNRHRLFVSTESGGVDMLTSENLLADSLTFKHFNHNNGMPTDVTLSTTSVGNRLLVVCNNQIVLLNADNGQCEAFDSHFFRSPVFFSDARPTAMPNGQWLFGLQDGAFAISYKDLRKRNSVPPLAVTAVAVQNQQPSKAVGLIDSLVLGSDERSVTVYFAALDYRDANAISYAFRLLGNDNDAQWNDVGRNASVTLLDLAPGTYRLQLRSTNADGVWVDNSRTLTIVVTPKWYETTWAMALFAALAVVLAATVVYTFFYIRRIKQQRRETLDAYLALLSKEEERHDVEDRPQVSAEDDMMMKRVTAFVEQHIADADINIGDIAAAAATSRSGLQRRMRQLMGITPLEFLREARIKRACTLLTQTEGNVSEVAFRCGFSDPKYFSRCFKASVGCSPTEYKERSGQ